MVVFLDLMLWVLGQAQLVWASLCVHSSGRASANRSTSPPFFFFFFFQRLGVVWGQMWGSRTWDSDSKTNSKPNLNSPRRHPSPQHHVDRSEVPGEAKLISAAVIWWDGIRAEFGRYGEGIGKSLPLFHAPSLSPKQVWWRRQQVHQRSLPR